MPDLQDGESIEIQGSARTPYVLKNVVGVFSCSCPAWRNQSLPIDQRTCKHLRKMRGDQAEQERIGVILPAGRQTQSTKKKSPPLLLAQRWENDVNLSGWWMSEKLDGVRAYWDGHQFLSRQGNRYHAPDWFVAGLPDIPLDGELWLGRKSFQRTVSIVRRQDQSQLWREIAFVVFDAPTEDTVFETRQSFLQATFREQQPQFARVLEQMHCNGLSHLQETLAQVESLGGEGLMLRQPNSRYEARRSPTLLKVKTFHDADARVIEHLPGRGRHKGRLGALAVQLPDGTRFSVGTGLTDNQREALPAIGSTITFRYQELTDGGVPRFPSYLRVRHDTDAATLDPPCSQTKPLFSANEDLRMQNRYFEFIGGNSRKFWEVTVNGSDATVRYGRIGGAGQTNTKSFADDTAANRHAEKLIASKIKKGYTETVSK